MKKYAIIFLVFAPLVLCENSYVAEIENGIQNVCNTVDFVTHYLENFNDRYLGESEIGKMLGYKDMKPVIGKSDNRGMKKMSMAMMPLMFHVGATSSFMILTAVMAAKSVLIGLILLVFKIAVSSAKVAAFFTQLKSKTSDQHEYSWTPHGNFGNDRSMHDTSPQAVWNSYTPDWKEHAVTDFNPAYKENQISYTDIEFEETKHNKGSIK